MSPPIFEKLVLSLQTQVIYFRHSYLFFQPKGRVFVKNISLPGDKLDHRNQKLPYRGK